MIACYLTSYVHMREFGIAWIRPNWYTWEQLQIFIYIYRYSLTIAIGSRKGYLTYKEKEARRNYED